MKPAIMNISKWGEKTAQAVRRICSRKHAPCVGFSLIFFDPMAESDERWNYVIELAYDPNNPPTEEEQLRLRHAFEFVSEGVRRIMIGEPVLDDIEEDTRKVQWH